MSKTPKILIYTDGGSRGNPGPAACAAVVQSADDNQTLIEEGKFLGRATNNVAEYEGVLLGMDLARRLGVRQIEIRSDSELLVRQLMGQYRVKNPGLKPLYDRVREGLGDFDAVEVCHVRREQNVEADRLVNETLDAQRKGGSAPPSGRRTPDSGRGGPFRLK
ncbi:MAG: ribonuclease HI family protein [Phycisphaerae bacterium]|nr:ribonuclease HI family protein [Phycisphaerae bacterium]